ncbi:hypothetical protein Bbelb_083300 [Branchiostoma belcheri]|nr:hypothetical protein Bbelb_083300 [Branchiostoma belcheri]
MAAIMRGHLPVVLCPPVEVPANGAVQVSGRQTGDRARFTCAPGYEMKGPQSILCQDGVWDGDKPTCEPKGDIRLDSTDSYNQGQKDSGVYSIQPRDSDDVFRAWCEFEDGGAWTVIQRRQDGSVDFFRNWQEYKDVASGGVVGDHSTVNRETRVRSRVVPGTCLDMRPTLCPWERHFVRLSSLHPGFGDVAGEYWLGNNNIYRLTNQAKYKLRIDLEDFNGRTFFAEYSHFRVENEADDYRLRLGNHSGNIGDGMTKLDRDQPFTTKDHGAKQGSHCASVQKTGWWFGKVCLNWANLNGMYKDSGEYTGEQNGIFWFPLRLIGYSKQHSLKKVTMKLRRLAETEPTTTPAPEECKGQCNDCSDAFNYYKQDGVYTIEPEAGVSFQVYCRMVVGGGWTVIQRRKDGSESFFRTWADYKNGFGDPRNEMWLGNEKIHALTKRGVYKLRVDLADFQGNEGFAEYEMFYVAGEKDLYRLRLGRYSGTAKDSLSYHANLPFSTKDRENDGDKSNCADVNKGGWWYDGCYASNLNGQWYPAESHTRHPDGLVWWQWPYWDNNYHFSLKSTEMRIQFQPDAQDTELYVDCDAVKRSGERGSGVFWIRPRNTVEPFPVVCDLQDGDAAWTVIQQRNHTVEENFTRGWKDYKNGFGVIPREYWLGNDKIHKLTKDGDFRVKIHVQAFNGLVGSYQYDNFRVAGEDENYRLALSGFTGKAGSCMERAGADLNGMAFSTMDRDNDKASYSCAERLKGGWWYKRCSLLILNGIIKKYSGHEEYREVTGRGEGLYNVCLQQGPPVSLGWVTIKIQARQRPDVYRDCDHARSDGKAASGVYHIQPRVSN